MTTINTEIDKTLADLQAELPDSNPYMVGSYLRALGVAIGGRSYEFYRVLEEVRRQSYPDTATGDALTRWGLASRVTRKVASVATGSLIVTGVFGTTIPLGTAFLSSDGVALTSTLLASIADSTISITSLTSVGTTATATTSSAHRFATGNSPTISGATPTGYNGTFSIVVTSETTFEYTLGSSLSTPSGTITAALSTAVVPVVSDNTGLLQNSISGTSFDFVTPITDADTPAIVYYNGIAGGEDDEKESSYAVRVNDTWRNPPTGFNESAIKQLVLAQSGVTRAWVTSPAAGQVNIRFMRDGDINTIPTGSRVTDMQAVIETIRPGGTDPVDVSVAGPTATTVDLVFSAISPNTVNMQTAVNASLESFFKENTDYETDIPLDRIKASIYQAYDPVDRLRVSSFTLTSPAADVTVPAGHIGVFGTTTYPVL